MAFSRNDADILHSPGITGGKILGLASTFARNIVLRRYGHDTETTQTCPGESRCDIWQGSSGATHEIRERNACIGVPEKGFPGCDKYPTKTPEGKKEQNALIELVERAIRIRHEREAGYPRGKERMRSIEFHLYLLINELIESEEFIMRRQTATAMKNMMAFGKTGQ